MKYHLIAAAALLMPLTGCLWSSYRDIAYFDLTPVPGAVSGEVRIAELRNASGAGSRFQYRDKTGRIVTDPDCKWVLPPGALVTRALRASLTPKTVSGAKTAHVSGEILFFEVRQDAGKFHLLANLRVSAGGKEKTVHCDLTAPVADSSPEAVVRAANQTVLEMAKLLNRAL